MTAQPLPASDTETKVEPLVWTELQTVPTHGLARSPHLPVPRPVFQGLHHVRRFSGRSHHTPAQARGWLTGVLREWHVPLKIISNLTLVASELTTNSVTHAPGESVSVGVALTEHRVWLVVVDQGPRRRILPQQPGADDEHGRGLILVEALASRYEVSPTGDGTTVRACIDLPAPDAELEAGDGPDSAPTVHAPTRDGSDTLHISEDFNDAPRSHS